MAESRKITFTKRTIEALEPPEKGRLQVRDVKVPGLVLRVTPAGSRTFFVYRRVQGRPVRYRLGSWPTMTIDQARRAAAVANGEIAKGRDPQADRQTERRDRAARDQARWTLGDLWAHYLDQYVKVHLRPKTEQGYSYLYKKYLAKWKQRELGTITTEHVASLCGKLGQRSPYQANRVKALIRSMYNHARTTLKQRVENPAVGIRSFTEESRDRFLDADELRRFLQAVKSESDPVFKDFFGLLLWTGARKGNVMAMTWASVDLQRGVWTIPGTQSKSHAPMSVILTEPAVEILTERKQTRGTSEFVFPSYGRTGHIIEPRIAWTALVKRAGLEDIRIHDLRRTHGSWQAAGGSSLQVIGASLGHRSLTATAIYSRLDIDPVRESVNKATEAMLTAAKPAKRKRKAKGGKVA